MFKDISEVKSIQEIEAMSLDEAQDYIIKAKAQFSTLSLIKYWKTNSKYLYSKIYKKYNIPTTGNISKVSKQNKWQEENEIKLKEVIDKSKLEIAMDSESLFKDPPPFQIEKIKNYPNCTFNILQDLNLHFKSAKIDNFTSEKDGISIVLDSGSKIKISPLTNEKMKLGIELSAIYTI